MPSTTLSLRTIPDSQGQTPKWPLVLLTTPSICWAATTMDGISRHTISAPPRLQSPKKICFPQKSMVTATITPKFGHCAIYQIALNVEVVQNLSKKTFIFTQFADELFMINPLGDSLSVYDLSTNTFTAIFNGHSIPIHVGHLSCLGSDANTLYVVGGGSRSSALSSVQILDIDDGSWSMGPEMKQNRNRHSCIVDQSKGTKSETKTL